MQFDEIPQGRIVDQLRRADHPTTGIVDQHVDATETLERVFDYPRSCFGIPDVERHRREPIRMLRRNICNGFRATNCRDHRVP